MIRVLFLAANPADTDSLRLDEEAREIDLAVRQAEFRDLLDVRSHWAVRADDLQDLLLRYRPQIVHYSGHGTEQSEIVLADRSGLAAPVPDVVLADLFRIFQSNIRCVVLNACFSRRQADVIAESIGSVIGMTNTVSDRSAIAFAGGFYRALAYGCDILTAFNLGRNQILLLNPADKSEPALITRTDPGAVSLVSDPPRSRGSLIVDIGSIRPSSGWSVVGEVRFSLSNYGNLPIKVTSISLDTLDRLQSQRTLATHPAGPIDEYSLFADVRSGAPTTELIQQHHLLNGGETDGFFLKISATDGFAYTFRLTVSWHPLEYGPTTTHSPTFTIDYPATGTDALLRLAQQVRDGGAESQR